MSIVWYFQYPKFELPVFLDKKSLFYFQELEMYIFLTLSALNVGKLVAHIVPQAPARHR